MGPKRILIAEDHELVRAGFCALIRAMEGMSIVGEAKEGQEALEKVLRLRPNILLLDISMPGLNGLEVARKVTKEAPEVKIIILSVHSDQEYVIRALKAGAKGYIIKDSGVEELSLALRAVSEGGTFISPKVSGPLIDHVLENKSAEPEDLTPRQREILQLMAEGNTVKDIAKKLNLSTKTIEAHKLQIMQRLNIHNKAGLVRYAIKRGLVSP